MKQAVRKAKLAYLWATRILFAPSKQGVGFLKKLDLNLRGGFVADQYALFDLAHNDRADYLSELDWYRSRYINAPFDSMLNNKVVADEVLKVHTKTPGVLLVKNKGKITTPGEADVSTDVERALDVAHAAGSVFVKPIGAGKGIGVHRIDADPEGRRWRLDGRAASSGDLLSLLDEMDGWFLSPTVRQHDELARIFPDASNTLRVITLRDPKTASLKVFFAVLRLGTQATVPVDNGSRGGLVAKVDLETGELTEARPLWSAGAFKVHPDTGAQIKGARVPMWEETKRLALRLAGTFPYLHFVAWDILVTNDGPCVIEANTSSGVNIIQMWGPQRNGELGDFFRAHGVIR